MTTLEKYTSNIRILIISLLAFSVGLGIAASNIAKTLTLTIGLATILFKSQSGKINKKNQLYWTPIAIFSSLTILALTLIWTQAPLDDALAAWGKHSKLILIPLIILLVQKSQEAIIFLVAYLAAQIFLLVSSWLLALQVSIPWATADRALSEYAVFSSYLGQSIMSCVLTAICWHLLPLAPNRLWKTIGITVIFLGLINIIFIMQGRTGHLIAIAIISQSLIWITPTRFRRIGLIIPALVIIFLFNSSTILQQRFNSAYDEVKAFAQTSNTQSSSGERLNYWGRSIESIVESPLIGHGVGSWNEQYLRIDKGRGSASSFNVRNPHQEFLLWGVEAGIIGTMALVSIFISIYLDTKTMLPPIARAIQSILLCLIISCFFNSSLYDGLIGNFFCVTLGIIISLGIHTKKIINKNSPEYNFDEKTKY